MRSPGPTALIYSVSFFILGLSTVIAEPGAEDSPANAAGIALRRSWEITPYVSLTQTFTDNVLLNDSNKVSDLILILAPGIQIRADSVRLKGSLNYSRRENFYTNDNGRDTGQNSLDARGTLEAIEDRLFLDVSGTISQQAISAFGTQSTSTTTVNPNQTETLNLQISPYLKGMVSDYATYEARYRSNTTETKAGLSSDYHNQDWSLNLRSAMPVFGVDWSLLGQMSSADFGTGSPRESETFRGEFSYRLSTQLKLRAALGVEANNYLTSESQSYSSNNIGIDWALSERSKISITKGSEYFGDSHAVVLEHRTPLSAWKFSDTRSASALPAQFTSNSLGTSYDMFYSLFASQEPDPVKRDKLVTDYLKANGIAANQMVNAGYLSSSVTVQRRQELSMTLIGAKNTITAMAQRVQSDRIGGTTGTGDAFANSSNIEQNGIGLTWAYRLSPHSTINMGALRNKTTSSQSEQKSNLTALTLGLSTRLGARTNATLSARHTDYESNVNSYKENALVGSVTMQYH